MINKFLVNAYRKILRLLPTKMALYVIYFRGYKKILNLKNPQTFGEKIQWLKLNGGLEELSNFVDKYEVRKYVTDVIGEQYLNDLVGVYDTVDEIDFEKLPSKFVIKCTNGSGTVIVCKDKKQLDIKKAQKEMSKWLIDDYSKEKKEFQYKNVKNRIIIEKYIENDDESLTDFKFFCFNGKAKYYAIWYDRFTNKSVDVYSVKDGKLKDVKYCNVQNSENRVIDSNNINEMIRLSEKLSKIFSFVRVDFYCVNNHPIFGELTFTHGAGSDPWNPAKFDLEMANLIPMEKVLKDYKIIKNKK